MRVEDMAFKFLIIIINTVVLACSGTLLVIAPFTWPYTGTAILISLGTMKLIRGSKEGNK